MAASKKVLTICVALAAFMVAGASCASDQPETAPATPRYESPTGHPQVAPAAPSGVALAAPTGEPASPSATGKTAAIVPERSPGTAAQEPAKPVAPPARAMTAADFPAPPDRDLLELARQLRWKGEEPMAGPGRFAGASLAVGDTAEFWTLDYPRRRMVRKEFRLAAVSDHAYWWIEVGLNVGDDDLQRTVDGAETRVYPRVTAVFGEPPELAGGSARGHIINGRIPGVGGYVSGADPYPSTVQPFSNEVPAIYINARAVPLGDEHYLDVLAHELQHAIHWYADPSEATWLNEGLSELAVTEAGFFPGSMAYYLRRPNVSLVNWPAELGGDVGRNYGAGALFAHYLREHYAPEGDLRDLLAEPSDGIAAVDAFLRGRGATTTTGEPADFHAVFADWMVANLLDSDHNGYGYAGLDARANITRTVRIGDGGATVSLPQYGIDYLEMKDADGEFTIHFEGVGETPLLPAEVPDAGCWWTNRGDDISSALTRSLAVPAIGADDPDPALTFRRWHEIEEDWDYLYVEVSTDGGATWTALPAEGATDHNPLGNSYGHGYTGSSDWHEVKVPLPDYAGLDILVRFHYVTDDAIHGPGACLSDMSVSWDDAGAGDWEADGFVRVNNRVRQDWIVRVIRDGPQPAATRLALRWDDEQQRHIGTAAAPPVGKDGRVVVAVSPIAPATMEPGRYRVWATGGN